MRIIATAATVRAAPVMVQGRRFLVYLVGGMKHIICPRCRGAVDLVTARTTFANTRFPKGAPSHYFPSQKLRRDVRLVVCQDCLHEAARLRGEACETCGGQVQVVARRKGWKKSRYFCTRHFTQFLDERALKRDRRRIEVRGAVQEKVGEKVKVSRKKPKVVNPLAVGLVPRSCF